MVSLFVAPPILYSSLVAETVLLLVCTVTQPLSTD